jgi:hypothetical protein
MVGTITNAEAAEAIAVAEEFVTTMEQRLLP